MLRNSQTNPELELEVDTFASYVFQKFESMDQGLLDFPAFTAGMNATSPPGSVRARLCHCILMGKTDLESDFAATDIVGRVLLAQVTKGTSTVQTLFVDGQGIDQHLFEINSSTGLQGFMTDHLGSVVNSSAIGGTSAYGLFGENLGAAMPANSGTEALTYGFSGREYDPESGYYYYRAWYFDPNTARFLTKDPVGPGAGGDMNSYRYAGNNPVNLYDPTGKEAFAALAAGGIGFVSQGTSNFILAYSANAPWPLIAASTVGGALIGGAAGLAAGFSNFALAPVAYGVGAAVNNAFNQRLFTGQVQPDSAVGAGFVGGAFGGAGSYGLALGAANFLNQEGLSVLSSLLGSVTGLTSSSGIPSSYGGSDESGFVNGYINGYGSDVGNDSSGFSNENSSYGDGFGDGSGEGSGDGSGD